MNFRSRFHPRDARIDINVIPLIDVLLVVLIFLVASSTFTRISELPISLPRATSSAEMVDANVIAISHDGQYALNGKFIIDDSPDAVEAALRQLSPQQPLVIYADAMAAHAAVVKVLEAARNANLEKISVATQGDLR